LKVKNGAVNDIVAIANGYNTVSYGFLSLGNSSPYTVSQKILVDQVNNLGAANRVRGLHINN
jgi:hypothetical protein